MKLNWSKSGPDNQVKSTVQDLRAKPLRLLALLSVTIFVAETLVMMSFEHFDTADDLMALVGIHHASIHGSVFESLLDGFLLTVLVFPILYFFVFKNLSRKNKALADSERLLEDRVKERTRALNQIVRSLDRRQSEIFMLNEMIHRFQGCDTLNAVYLVLEDNLGALFPDLSGCLSLNGVSSGTDNLLHSWGKAAPFQMGDLPDSCQSLDGKTPRIFINHPDDASQDVSSDKNRSTWQICLPLILHDETIGAMFLTAPYDPTGSQDGEDVDRRGLFWGTLAESLAMSVSNLNLRETLQDQALKDPLTGLFNRRHLNDCLDREIHRADRGHQKLSVFMIDIDYFKRFNDTHGHDAGDAVLKAMGHLLNDWVRMEDIVTRSGGEEFVAALPGADGETALKRAELLRQQVEKLNLTHEGQALGQITVSIGISVFPDHGDDKASLIKAADASMYEAKQAGRNRVILAPIQEFPVAVSL